jgi:hypothetical protein
MGIKYTIIFHSKALQNLPKLGFFGLDIYYLATEMQAPKCPFNSKLKMRAAQKLHGLLCTAQGNWNRNRPLLKDCAQKNSFAQIMF